MSYLWVYESNNVPINVPSEIQMSTSMPSSTTSMPSTTTSMPSTTTSMPSSTTSMPSSTTSMPSSTTSQINKLKYVSFISYGSKFENNNYIAYNYTSFNEVNQYIQDQIKINLFLLF
jgi:hypothetical protein